MATSPFGLVVAVIDFARQLAITILALTRTTRFAARVLGVRPFLPALSASRFSVLGGLYRTTFIRQLDACKSFEDSNWAAYWSRIAEQHLDSLASDDALHCASWVTDLKAGRPSPPPQELLEVLARGSWLLRYHDSLHTPVDVDQLESSISSSQLHDARTLNALWKAVTYYFCAAWPGKTPYRQHAYSQSRAAFDVLLDGVATPLKFKVERDTVEVEGEQVTYYILLPLGIEKSSTHSLPAIFLGNGLEGVDQEFILPLLRILSGTPAVFFVAEMPGTYAFSKPMIPPARTERIYDALHARFRAHPLVDPTRFGILGLSFGANWATRMLVRDAGRGRDGAIIKAAVVNGLPNQQTFHPTGTLGIPQIMADALGDMAGAGNPLSLLFRLRQLIIEPAQLRKITIPLLLVNGDTDTLCATADSIDIARYAQNTTLKLYPDDHCAMDHMEDHLRLSVDFLLQHL